MNNLMNILILPGIPRMHRGGSFEKETWRIGIHGELERRELK